MRDLVSHVRTFFTAIQEVKVNVQDARAVPSEESGGHPPVHRLQAHQPTHLDLDVSKGVYDAPGVASSPTGRRLRVYVAVPQRGSRTLFISRMYR
jgi:hypothetical protein